MHGGWVLGRECRRKENKAINQPPGFCVNCNWNECLGHSAGNCNRYWPTGPKWSDGNERESGGTSTAEINALPAACVNVSRIQVAERKRKKGVKKKNQTGYRCLNRSVFTEPRYSSQTFGCSLGARWETGREKKVLEKHSEVQIVPTLILRAARERKKTQRMSRCIASMQVSCRASCIKCQGVSL